MRLFIVEDEKEICDTVAKSLYDAGYEVDTCYDGEEALAGILTENYDLVVLDLNLPGMDGMEILKELRQENEETKVLILSARGQIADKVEALDAGADDYLTKPFSVEELLARLRVTFRRLNDSREEQVQNSVFQDGDLKIDYAGGCAFMKDKELHLTPIEYKLLCLLSKNVGKVLTHTYITKAIWGSAWDNDVASLRVFMATLRKKIEPNPSEPMYIQTHIGVGYRMLKV